jgi:hypothetical protein
MGKKPRSGSGINIMDHNYESLETLFGLKILKFFDADPESFSPWIRGPIRKKFGSGIRINILAPQLWLKAGIVGELP